MTSVYTFLSGYSLALLTATAMAAADMGGHLCISRFPELEAEGSLLTIPIKDKRFSLRFIHSVSNSLVFDDYVIRDGTIVQTRERFLDHGAGLPSMTDNENDGNWTLVDGVFHLKLNRTIDKLIVRVNPEYQNTLLLHNASYDLTRWGRLALEISTCH